jgi:hypothetical protein
MYSSKNELQSKFSDEYADFGLPYSDYPLETDYTQRCLPGDFMNSGIADLDMCPAYIAQRCADSWDSKCGVYLESLWDVNKRRGFIRDVIQRKYFELSPDSSCSINCQPFDPIAQQSPNVCSVMGNEAYLDSSNRIDVGDITGEGIVVSPVYMGSCNTVRKNVSITDDPLITASIASGFTDELSMLCGGDVKSEMLSGVCRGHTLKTRLASSAPTSQSAVSDPSIMNPPGVYKSVGDSRFYRFLVLLLIAVLAFVVIGMKNNKK